MSIKDQGHSLTLVKGHLDFQVKRLIFSSPRQSPGRAIVLPPTSALGGGGGVSKMLKFLH